MIIQDQDLYYSNILNNSKVFSAFGTKKFRATDDNVVVAEFCKRNEIQAKLLYRPDQIHSSTIRILDSVDDARVEQGDGVITNLAHVALIVKTADCVPIIFSDKVTGFVGISHQGWKGTYLNLASEMIVRFLEKGSEIKNIQVAIGPSINLCCYEVQDDVFLKFKEKFPEHFSKVTLNRDNKKKINLLQLNYLFLKDAGLQKDQIDYFPFCTSCNEKRFFSYRRDYVKNHEAFGQQLSFIIKQ